MTRRLVAGLWLMAAICVLSVRAEDPRRPAPPAENKNKVKDADDVDPKARIEEAASQQERLRHQFEEFKQSLLRLKQRLESSPKPEDRDKAKVLDEALARASEQGTDSKFSTLVAALKGSDAFKDLDQLGTILDKNDDLRKDIHMLIELLLRDDRDAQLRKEREQLSRMLEQLKEVILKQEKTRAQTEMGRKSAAELEKLQKKVTEDTKDLVARRDAQKSAGKDSKKSDSKKGDKSGEKNDANPGEPKDSKSGEPKDGKKSGEPKDGQPSQPKDGEPGDQKDGQQANKQEQQQESNPVKKQIQEANKHQEGAEKDLNEKKNPDAVAKQDKALEELNKAKKRLEDLLKQLREEEKERLLAALQARCERMLAMQIAVRDGTVTLDKEIDKKDPNREQQQTSNVLSDREEEIIREASKAISIIQAEGSAIAFAEVFLQVRTDMTTVANHLRKTDTSVVTQTVENDIIATLQEMIEALKKARKDNKNPPPPPRPGQQGPPPDQRLIDMLAELKMIRSMQLRVNSRTEVYGKQYEGEQAPAPTLAADAKLREQYEMIQRELRDLGERQLKIEKVTSDIAKGKNKAN
jgi:hypothetical protein